MINQEELNLKYGIRFSDIYSSPETIIQIDLLFLDYLHQYDPCLHESLLKYRLTSCYDANLTTELAPILEDFLVHFLDIEEENLALRVSCNDFAPIYDCRRQFVQRYALRQYPPDKLQELDFKLITEQLKSLLSTKRITERQIVQLYDILIHTKEKQGSKDQLELLAQYCAFMVFYNSKLMLFDVPRAKSIDKKKLREYKISQLKEDPYIGFDYRDKELSTDRAHAHARYCIICHKQGKDSCSKGLKASNINGCPLEQKISEMNELKSKGYNLAALAVAMIDNPLIAATGHRICNDCIKACIYQKQDAVNVPMVESHILSSILELPWGVEIYSLLTLWNPLKPRDYMPKRDSGYNILVVGLGPAGFATSYYLLQDGHNILAIDGMKISPIGFDVTKAIKNWSECKSRLSTRTPQGFGGVAEYGITSRWDKNNLTLIRLILERRANFYMQGSTRLGSNITIEQIWEQKFDHIALCLGAGKPRLLTEISSMPKGVKMAADFLMQLQQGGAFLQNSNNNLLIRLPLLVVGAGLTAVDAAVEAIHYYPKQVRRFKELYRHAQDSGLKYVFNIEDQEIITEFLSHADMFESAKTDSEILDIINSIGGVSLCYRKNIEQSPAYILNSEELEHMLAMGVKIHEDTSPIALSKTPSGWLKEAICQDGKTIKANSMLVAIGTEANEFIDVNIESSTPPCSDMGNYMETIKEIRQQTNIFMDDNCRISHFGDCNPSYHGSVVKAIASARNNYQHVSNILNQQGGPRYEGKVKMDLSSRVAALNRLAAGVLEIVIHSPWAVKNFQPGQFFKLQNITLNPAEMMEPVALTGAYIDKERDLLSLVVLEYGRSTKLCSSLKIGEEVALMGPTGASHDIVANQDIMLIGHGIGNATLISLGAALKAAGCRVTQIAAGYKNPDARFFIDKLEAYADKIIWCFEEIDAYQKLNIRQYDAYIVGDITKGIQHYLSGTADIRTDAREVGSSKTARHKLDKIICIAPASIMQNIYEYCRPIFPESEIICSLNSPMQCMMKGVCGQCVQKTFDDKKYIFACIAQNQQAFLIDFDELKTRLTHNHIFEIFN